MKRSWRLRAWQAALMVGYLLFYAVHLAECCYSLPRGLNPDCVGMVGRLVEQSLRFAAMRWFALGVCQRYPWLNLWFFAPAVALLCLGYLGALRDVQRRPEEWSLSRLLGTAGLAALPLLLMLPPTSADYLSYLFAGRVLCLHHVSPWQHRLGEFPAEFGYLPVEVWSADLKCIYGPVWVALMAGITAVCQLFRPDDLTPAGFLASVLLLRVVNAVALGAGAVAVWRINGLLWPRQQCLVTAAFLLNPLILFEGLGALHNDLWGAVFLLWACYLFLKSDPRYLGLLALSILIKPIAVAMIPFLVVYHLRQGERVRLGWLAAAAVGTLAVLKLTSGEYLLSHLAGGTRKFQYSSTALPQFAAAALAMLRPESDFVTSAQAASPVLLALFGALSLALLWRTRTREQVVQYSAWALALYLSAAYLQTMPWYFTWPLALLCATAWTPASANAVLASGAVLLGYGMYFWNHNGGDPPSLVISFLLAMAAPILLLLAGKWGWWTVWERSVIKQSQSDRRRTQEARQHGVDPAHTRTTRTEPRSA